MTNEQARQVQCGDIAVFYVERTNFKPGDLGRVVDIYNNAASIYGPPDPQCPGGALADIAEQGITWDILFLDDLDEEMADRIIFEEDAVRPLVKPR